ncbi:hypothetical protein DFQ14_10247 [Halopolyspora algeriensis]|uniref:Uncharacterized protein n=1 Tax=Halopolyspora algeriensis TaxID=1500506 RepID=A0A368VUG3_9ACTN|nr:hypothetical protein DFQ14_10247 [Halopolyspora algeriensis]TQM54130.1 hypothetical protein FHU43_2309 [Halopolyspora algeriensis]
MWRPPADTVLADGEMLPRLHRWFERADEQILIAAFLYEFFSDVVAPEHPGRWSFPGLCGHIMKCSGFAEISS